MNLFNLVWLELGQRKSQLLSGMLAIVLGISVIVAIRSVSIVSETAVAINLDNLGANILVLPQGASIDNYYSADIDSPTIPEEYVTRIVNSTIPGVDNLMPRLSRRVEIYGTNLVLSGILPKNELASKPLWQSSGLFGAELEAACGDNPINESHGYEDEKLQRKAIDSLKLTDCLLGASAARRLKVNEGDVLTINDFELQVAKVLSETGTVDDDRVFVHLHKAQQVLGIPDQVSAIEIMGCCNAISDGLLGKLRNILPDTRITTIGQIVSTQVKTNQLMSRISIVMLIIIIIIGGISIGNYMWANVNERKKEIGIMRMIGFPRTAIYRTLIYKAIILGISGGVLGFVAGITIAWFIGPLIAGVNINPIPELLGWAVFISVLISIVGSLFPAHLASKFEPFSNMQDT
nr:ABC transporter permease [Bacteroidota bacterium]